MYAAQLKHDLMYAMSKKPATVNSAAKAHAEYSDGEDEDIDYGDE
jgi:hypothetical protein